MAATFEKANTYVFAALIIRDREVGGSNPLAPTKIAKEIKEKGRMSSGLYSFVPFFVPNGFLFDHFGACCLRF